RHFGPEHGLASDQVFSLHEDAAGRLWAGSFGQGLSVREPGAARFRVYGRKDGLPGDVVNAIAEVEGQLYVGTNGGLARRVGARFEPVPGFEDQNLVALQPAREGGLWVASQTRGLGRLKPGEPVRFYGAEQGLGSEYVTSVLEREDGTVWLTTFGGGLLRLRDGNLQSFTRAQGLPEDALHAVVDDGRGRLWMSSNKGVYTVPLESLEAVGAGRAQRLSVRTWGTADGMRSNECNGGEQPVAWKARDGRLHFATIKGVATVDPGRPAPQLPPPVVHIEHVVMDGKEVPADEGLRVPPGVRNLEVHYTAPALHAPERVRFRFRLEGSDKEWSEVEGRRTAYFTGLGPGRYEFQVMAAHEEGPWGEAGDSLRFTMVPHFHETPAFAALTVLGLLLLVGGAYMLRIRYVRRRELELVAHNVELTAALATAQEAARVKGEFVANTSHELRTPLNTLINAPQVLLRQFSRGPGAFCEACSAHFELEPGEKLEPQSPCPECGAVGRLRDEPRWQLRGEPGKVVRLLEMMVSSGKHLLEVVDDVLDFSKLEAGRVVVEPRRLPVSELFESVITTVQPAARARRIRLEVQLPSQPLVLWADPLRSQQVLINLLSNAVKFSTEDSSVRLEAAREGDCALLTVRDRGVGIAPEHHRLIFESFRQVDGTHTRRVGGTGLGLSIVKRLVDLQGGAIWLESALGQGSTFYVRLPLAPTVEAADEAVASAPTAANEPTPEDASASPAATELHR
ncbi:MAG TPA: ATP-binding protein, partial [Aggregicoccus sp.]|nr:ATP-binding protein [Aggregicoccus sp.]